MRAQIILFDVIVSTAICVLLVCAALQFFGRIRGSSADYGAAAYNSYLSSARMVSSYGGWQYGNG